MSEVQRSINHRIQEFIDFKGMSLHRFGEKAGFASGGLSRAIKEDRTFSVDKLMQIYQAFPELSAIWLQFGRGDMINFGYELVSSTSKEKIYALTTDEKRLRDHQEIYNDPDKVISELKHKIVILEAKNEALLDAIRNLNLTSHRGDED